MYFVATSGADFIVAGVALVLCMNWKSNVSACSNSKQIFISIFYMYIYVYMISQREVLDGIGWALCSSHAPRQKPNVPATLVALGPISTKAASAQELPAHVQPPAARHPT